MAIPQIRINQGGSEGIAGQSRDDLVLNVEVEAFDDANTSGSWSWIFVPPPDSFANATGLTTSGIKFTPDTEGTYLLFVSHNGNELSYDEDAIGQRVSQQGGAAVKLVNGRRIPGVGETEQFDVDNGWATTMTRMIKEDIGLREEGTTVSGGPFITLDFKAAGGNNVSVVPTVSGIAEVTISGGSAIELEDEGTQLPGGPHTTLDFVGDGVTVTDAGGGTAQINVPGVEVKHDGATISGGVDCFDFHGAGVDATVSGGCVRVQVDGTGGGSGTDEDAIHDNVAGEIAAVTEKTTPVDADLLLIEDSEDSNNKKRVQLGNLPFSQDLAAANGDYIYVGLTSDTAVGSAGSTVPFNDEIEARGLSLGGGGKISTLKAGRTYLLMAGIRAGLEAVFHGWHDVTADVSIGKLGAGQSPSRTSGFTDNDVAAYIFTPTQDTEVELRISITVGSGNYLSSYSYAQIVEIGSVQAEVTGGLEFLDLIVVGSATSSVTFGASGDGVFKRALDGDVDGEYVLVHRTRATSTISTVDLRPNGITSNQVSRRVTHQNSTVTYPRLVIAQVPSGDLEGGELSFNAKTGEMRTYRSHNYLQTEDPATEGGQFIRSWAGTWDETATNITSLVIASDDASNGLDVGSEYVLYRRTRSNLRADSADTYERFMSAAVQEGTNAAVEYTLGHSIYNGSLLGFSARLEDAVTAGSVTVRIKVDGVTKLTGTLDTSNPTSIRPAPYPIGVHKVGANQNVSVEIETSGYTNAGSVTSTITVVAVLQNSAVLLRDPGGGRRHIKTIRVENGAVISVTFDNLDGDADGLYILEAEVNGSSHAGAIFVHPNGLSTNQFTRTTYVDPAPAGVTDTDLVLTSPNATGRWSSKTAKLHAKTGKARKWYSRGEMGNSSGTESWFEVNAGWWSDTTTNITSLVIKHESGAANIGVGSEFRLYKLTEGEGQVEVL